MKKKRICFVTTLPVTLKAFVFPQAEYLLRNGWDVTFVCAEEASFDQEIPKGARYVPVPFRRGVDPLGVPRAILKLYRMFKRECFDLVQYSTPNAAFYAATASWLAGIPVRLYAQWGIRYVGFTGLVKVVFKQIERWCCRCSTVIEPDSVGNLEFSIREGLYPRDKGRVIWNGSACGINIERFDISQKDIWRTAYRKKIGCDVHHLVIGFVGSIRADKGCNELIAACRSFFPNMPLARLLLIGDKDFYFTIDKNSRDWLESSNQVIHVPPNNQIPQYLACMDVFALPSYREGFGMVIIEAEAMGVPVVASDVPGPADAMRHEVTGLMVPVKDAGALAEALQVLLRDPVKRAAYGAAAATFARDGFEQKKYLQYVLADKEQLITREGLV
ncbi:MAG TPA: glycosyltransferase [Smithellaceae bacterium]|nr:glycosyltransferase [Desulfobacterales bacterium]HOQ43236.1 glycosyltransferase [Smithellaceae bacterium]